MSQVTSNESGNVTVVSNEFDSNTTVPDGRYRYGKGLLPKAPNQVTEHTSKEKVSAYWLERIGDSAFSKALDIVENYEEMRFGTDKLWFTQNDLKNYLASELEKLAAIIEAKLSKRSAKRLITSKSPGKSLAKR
ncbi:hypothetical protein DL768_011181 [Monosporascus sp. mg162]|nr:hypothetical protein DL768_011181 [Monosporascus sp. mg162]